MPRGVPKQTSLRYPDFICIGAQKAGTTWLHQKLSQRKDTWLPPVKELHYFDSLHLGWPRDSDTGLTATDMGVMRGALRKIGSTMNRSYSDMEKLKRIYSLSLVGARELTDEWYGRIFQAAPSESLCGEVTPSYALLPEAGIEHMVTLRPGVKIIFIMRDPIDRGWSELRMMQTRRGEDAEDNQAFNRRISGKEFLDRSDYLGTIERYRRHVREENFLPVYFDNLTEQPNEFLTEICNFLGLDLKKGKFHKVDKAVHKGQPKTIEPELYERLRANLAPAYKRLRTMENPITEKWYQTHYG